MPANPTDGKQASRIHTSVPLNQDQVQWIDWERADRHELDWDQIQGITRSGRNSTRTKTRGARGDNASWAHADQGQWITGSVEGRQCGANRSAGSTRTKSSGSTGSNTDRQKAEQRGKDGGSPKNALLHL